VSVETARRSEPAVVAAKPTVLALAATATWIFYLNVAGMPQLA
jgi:hypothetical protein